MLRLDVTNGRMKSARISVFNVLLFLVFKRKEALPKKVKVEPVKMFLGFTSLLKLRLF